MGSYEPGTMEEDQLYISQFGHLNDQMYIYYKSQYCTSNFPVAFLVPQVLPSFGGKNMKGV